MQNRISKNGAGLQRITASVKLLYFAVMEICLFSSCTCHGGIVSVAVLVSSTFRTWFSSISLEEDRVVKVFFPVREFF